MAYTAYHSANLLLKCSLKCLSVLYPDSCPYPESAILTFEVAIQCNCCGKLDPFKDMHAFPYMINSHNNVKNRKNWRNQPLSTCQASCTKANR